MRSSHRAVKHCAKRHRRCQPQIGLEVLEPRLLLAAFMVDSMADKVDPDDGKLTLREAIMLANESEGPDEITFAPKLKGTLKLKEGELLITDDVTIIGNGTKKTKINAGKASRIFNIDNGDSESAIEVALTGMTIRNGAVDGDGGGIRNREVLSLTDILLRNNMASGLGGGLFSGSMATVENTTIRNNMAQGAGGGIYLDTDGVLEVQNSTLRNNTAAGDGGGFFVGNGAQGLFTLLSSQGNKADGHGGGGVVNGTGTFANSQFTGNMAGGNGGGLFSDSGDLNIDDLLFRRNRAGICGGALAGLNDVNIRIDYSTLTGNTAGILGGAVYSEGQAHLFAATVSGNRAEDNGGGIFNDGTLTIVDSTLSGNATKRDGGGLFNNMDAQITNATFSGNRSHLFGGGIVNFGGGTLTVHNSTIAQNSADANNNREGQGGGIFNLGTSTLHSNIIANNTAGKGKNFDDFQGAAPDGESSFNLFRSDVPGLGDGVNGNILGANPQLLKLKNNGGPTLTHGLKFNSPAIDAGINLLDLPFEQRGEGFPRTFGPATDIGAFEFQPRGPLGLALIVGSDAGGAPIVRGFDSTGTQVFEIIPFDPSFTGGVRVAIGDVNGDGRDDVIVGAGPGAGPHIKVFSGRDLSELHNFFAYDPGFLGGVFVAAGDVNGDGRADIITGADAGSAGPHVKVFSGNTGAELDSFFAFDAMFDGGVRVAAGDVNGDGFSDIIVGAGAGAGPHVKVFSGNTGAELHSFFAYDPGFTGGVFVAAGDVNGDGLSDIITGPGVDDAGGELGPHVKVFDGLNLAELHSFFAFDSMFTGGVRVAAGDIDGDGIPDIITAPGAGRAPEVKVFDGTTGELLDSFFALGPMFQGGVFIGGK